MRILVPGGTNGMGKEVAKVLAGIDNQIHEVIILCKSARTKKLFKLQRVFYQRIIIQINKNHNNEY